MGNSIYSVKLAIIKMSVLLLFLMVKVFHVIMFDRKHQALFPGNTGDVSWPPGLATDQGTLA